MERIFDYQKTIQERIDELSNRPLDIKYNPDGSCEIDHEKFEKVLNDLNTLGSALHFNSDPLNLKDGDIYVDPQTKKIYVIQNNDKIEIKNEPVDVSPYMVVGNSNPTGNDWIRQRWSNMGTGLANPNWAVYTDIDDSITNTPIRVQTIVNNPVQCSTTIIYTDGRKEDISDLRYPSAIINQIKVGMTSAQVQNILSGGSSSTSSKAASRAHVSKPFQNAVYGANSKSPWSDPLAEAKEKASGCWATATDGQVFIHDIEPSMTRHQLIRQAVEILKKNKDLNIPRLNINIEPNGKDVRVVYSVISKPMGPDVRQGKLIEVLLHSKVFLRKDRHEIDDLAKLKEKLDTNTYLYLRIAYILFQVYKLSDANAKGFHSDLLTILGHTTKPVFSF